MKTPRAAARLERAVRLAIRDCVLAGGARSMVVAVSGGPDSLAMLISLSRLTPDLGLKLHGAHLDHGLRGDASRADATFVASTFRRLGIDLTSERADVASFREAQHLSVEEAARELRYSFLARVAAEHRADAVALGHTSDDQAETVLMNIIRGAGLVGLKGMEPVARRTFAGTELLFVRPLLRLARQDILAYCEALKLSPRLDESNTSNELTRNQVRMELLPLLEAYNPAVRDALVRLSHTAAQQVHYLDRRVDEIWQEAVRREPGQVTLDREVFLGLDPALQAHLLRHAIAKVMGDLKGIEQGHLDEMARLIEGPAGRTLDLPRGIRFSVSYDEATLSSGEGDPCPLPPLEGSHTLAVPGETIAGGWRVTADVVEAQRQRSSLGDAAGPADGLELGPDGLVAQVSHEALGAPLSVRGRRPGDRFQPLGMSGHKKLQDFMVDAKIPKQWRDRVPLVVSPKGIAWVAGWRIAHWAAVRDGDGRLVELALTRAT